MISQSVEYSLRAMVVLAQVTDQSVSVQTIAERGKIPSAYLSKLMKTLVNAGLVDSRRGVGGGYVLAKSADEITIKEIMDEVEPLQRIRKCPLGIKGHVNLCPLHEKLDQAFAEFEKAFATTTLGALLAQNNGSIPLCESESILRLNQQSQ